MGQPKGGGAPNTACGDRGLPPDVSQQGFLRDGGFAPPSMEEGADLQDFTPARANMLLQEVYGDSPHHKYGMYLIGGVPDTTIWQSHWKK